MRNTRLYNKIYGSLIGGAIGDAFGIRVEMMHYRDIEAQYGRVTHFDPLPPRRPSQESPLERWYPFGVQPQNEGGFHPLGRWSHEVGAYTDDMRYRLMACRAILRKGGPITGRDFAAEWLNYRLMAEGAEDHEPTLSWPGPQRAYARILASLDRLAEMVNQRRPCRIGWDAPLGYIHPGDPAGAAEDGYAMAVAVASALAPAASIDQVIADVLDHAYCMGAYAAEFSGRLNRLLEVAARCDDVFGLYEPFYNEFLVTFPPFEANFALEMVPFALAVCFICRDDAEQAIIGAANAGRDADTITGIVGELMGALGGIDSLPPAWVEQVERLNPDPDMAQMAADLCSLLRERVQAQKSRAEDVLSMLTA